MEKRRDTTVLFTKVKLDHNASQAANINRSWAEGSTCDRGVLCWFLKIGNGDTSLKVQAGRDRPSAVGNQHLKR